MNDLNVHLKGETLRTNQIYTNPAKIFMVGDTGFEPVTEPYLDSALPLYKRGPLPLS